MTRSLTTIAAAAALLAAACDNTADNDDTGASGDTVATAVETGAQRATALLRDARGRDVGTVLIEAEDGGARVSAQVAGLAPGEHGIHVHTVGQCDAAGRFESAGPHLNPTNAQHGMDNPNGPHAGDLPNLAVAADSTGSLSFTSTALRMGTGSELFDADGATVVVHADRDDQVTDPSGNSGARIACGVFENR